ncbi:MAG: DUF1653 domain-containing protein [Burkholderiaceae bacterium]
MTDPNSTLNSDSAEVLPPLIVTKPGFYRHYKGGEYEVVGTVRHSEDLQPMTLYRALYGEQGLWVRPAAMFNETVVINGVLQPRFTYLGEKKSL